MEAPVDVRDDDPGNGERQGLHAERLDGSALAVERVPNAEADLERSALLARLRRGGA